MTIDATAMADFYATRHGVMAARQIRARLAALWPDLTGMEVLGVGYPAPYLRVWREQAARCVVITPAQMGVTRWPASRLNLSAAAEEDSLPLADVSIDRLLMIHGLEHAEAARRMLREAWRVLRPEGRMIVVVPNRASPWAYLERTPFGHGQPYSAAQLGRLLAGSMFRVERRDMALLIPPLGLGKDLSTADLLERIGRRAVPQLGGVVLAEAVKDVAGVIPLMQGRRRLVFAESR
ncbi:MULTISPECIES: class I SAM-dependent methyltransferase [Acidiphilium]|uniref:Methyltransferase domain-containing protein n=1 Tax=Acidiphilium rubrum TaxID=526 RepID=A0A8G2CJL6_ACIRU|nr:MULTISPECIES: methyltransferase domain-containing protein [Acidiphilium]OYV99861.1 MAG: methyltransferase type 11 [Acidiphilium sp. 37-64-53]OZB22699.1 MAG: methyltransferase type 11 [Acidiphilium sp. 34-64-41]SIQ55094.1 Methyltransferase domain-containing protein [Acidiphilium rubrum]HQT86792.1 methyltransferase domain-containing protein [Acidiphilium rubrum]